MRDPVIDYDNMVESLRFKGFRRIDSYTWVFDHYKSYDRWILIEAFDEEIIKLNFFDENYFICTPYQICRGLAHFCKL
jgi:hypothetical protein